MQLKTWIEKLTGRKLFEIDEVGTGDFSVVFQRHLRNGVILCQVMRSIKQDSIPHIHEPSTNNNNNKNGNIYAASFQLFKMKENLSYFINAVEEFGVARYRLFQIQDLLTEDNQR